MIMTIAVEPRWKGWILIAASLIWFMSSPCTSLPQANPAKAVFRIVGNRHLLILPVFEIFVLISTPKSSQKMERGCGVILIRNGDIQLYEWLCDNHGPVAFYPDPSNGLYRFSVLTGFPSDANEFEALPKNANMYEISEDDAFKVAHSVLIRSNDCVYFPG